jgi:YD repeat-containing protein
MTALTTTQTYPRPAGRCGKTTASPLQPATTDFPNGVKEEYYYYGPYSWYISPNDYVEYVSADTNNYKLAKKTLYYLDRTDPKGRISKIESPAGGYTQYSDFDPSTNQPRTVTHYHGLDAGNNPILHSILYTYNSKGMTTSVKDAKNNFANIVYDPNNYVDVQSITNGQGTISFTWNTGHDITSITDRMSITTAMTYNAYGQMETIIQAQGTPVQTTTELVYDPTTKNLTNIKKNSNILNSFTYDTIGRVQTQTDAAGITLSYEYNNLDKVTKVTYPDNKFQLFTYSTIYKYH